MEPSSSSILETSTMLLASSLICSANAASAPALVLQHNSTTAQRGVRAQDLPYAVA